MAPGRGGYSLSDEAVIQHYSTVPWMDVNDLAKSSVDRVLIERGLFSTARVLNIGCGYPTDELRYGGRVREWIAIDFCPAVITRCRELKLSNVRFEQADARSLPFSDEYFDLVLSLSTFDHIQTTREKAFKESFRVLKKGGLAVIVLPVIGGTGKETADYGFTHWFGVGEAKSAVQPFGTVLLQHFCGVRHGWLIRRGSTWPV